jgi:hypothetical protein
MYKHLEEYTGRVEVEQSLKYYEMPGGAYREELGDALNDAE